LQKNPPRQNHENDPPSSAWHRLPPPLWEGGPFIRLPHHFSRRTWARMFRPIAKNRSLQLEIRSAPSKKGASPFFFEEQSRIPAGALFPSVELSPRFSLVLLALSRKNTSVQISRRSIREFRGKRAYELPDELTANRTRIYGKGRWRIINTSVVRRAFEPRSYSEKYDSTLRKRRAPFFVGQPRTCSPSRTAKI